MELYVPYSSRFGKRVKKGNTDVTMSDLKKKLDKGIAYLKRNGIRQAIWRAGRKAVLAREIDYAKWLKCRSADEKELMRQKNGRMSEKIRVTAVLFSGNKEQENRTIASVNSQTFGPLTIIRESDRMKEHIDQEHPDYCLLIQAGTILRPEALYQMVSALETERTADLLYTDHDIEGKDGQLKDPFCKPEYDEVFQDQMNYMGTVFLIRKNLSDLLLQKKEENIWKCLPAEAKKVMHLPEILYHVTEDMQKKLEDAKDWYEKKDLTDQPLLSVIIPNKDHAQDLRKCVESILKKGGYDNLEILIAENHSEEEETFALYQSFLEKENRIRIVEWTKSFNYSAINNAAVLQAKGKYLLFLNNDTEIKEKDSVYELMRCLVTEKAGAAGAALFYADKSIQHAGVVLGYGGVAGHAFEGMSEEQYKKRIYAKKIRQMSAVTAACMAVNRNAFEEIGGFTEELGVAYNDIDLCMKLRKAGWKVLYDPNAQFYHYESQTRGFEMTSQKAERVKREADYFCQTWREELDRGDPFYNSSLTLEKSDFSLKR